MAFGEQTYPEACSEKSFAEANLDSRERKQAGCPDVDAQAEQDTEGDLSRQWVVGDS